MLMFLQLPNKPQYFAMESYGKIVLIQNSLQEMLLFPTDLKREKNLPAFINVHPPV